MLGSLPERIHCEYFGISFAHKAALIWPDPAAYRPDAATDSRFGMHKCHPPCGPTDGTLRPSDSASQPPSSPPAAARSLSFAYDAQALHLSPPVLVAQLPSAPASPFASPLRFESPSPTFGGLFVRPSAPRTHSNAGTLRSDMSFSALSLGSGSVVIEHNEDARAYSPTFGRTEAERSSGRRSPSRSRSPSPEGDMFHSALGFASTTTDSGPFLARALNSGSSSTSPTSPTSPFSARALGSEFDFGEDTDEEIYEVGSDGDGSVGSSGSGSGSWGSVSGVSLSGAR
ncbi:hypothetical protein FIBSPDRAFT_1035801 [Athelia psychrophila]|uniref:Uncharacterized protein n=1 Tax=Athelia psychrophila TaxID=1759441 RepID=A0A166WJB9_9AGAM|nr:hypothetical protein FIBSPDRAFT_1035801 [Fibularhizoctonia sp. CBS 109695]